MTTITITRHHPRATSRQGPGKASSGLSGEGRFVRSVREMAVGDQGFD